MRQMVRPIKIIAKIASRYQLRPPFSIAFVGQDGPLDNGRYNLLIGAGAFEDFQKHWVDILGSEPEDMRKFLIRFFSSMDRIVGTTKQKFNEEWVN